MKYSESIVDPYKPINPEDNHRVPGISYAQDNGEISIYQNIFDLIGHSLILN